MVNGIPPVGEFWKRDTFGFAYAQLFSGGRFDNGIPNTTSPAARPILISVAPSASLLSPTTDIAVSEPT